jgi:GH18 family chitinase
MRIKVLFIILLINFRVFSGEARHLKPDFKIVGYYSIRSAMDDYNKFPFSRLTHVNLSFLNPDSLGNFTRDLSALKPFIAKAHKKNVKVLFSIAGGSVHPYYHTLLKEENRARFIQNLLSQVLNYNFDGIDVDIEGSDIDENYEVFVVDLARELRLQHKLITSAIAVYYKDQISDKAIAQYDFVNVMVYDRTGPWRPDKPGQHSSYADAVEDLDYFGTARNIPGGKMLLGVPFYGYGFGPEISSPVKSMDYNEIVSAFPGSESVDEWKTADGNIMYYNGMPTIKKKTELAMEKASGIMIWQVGGDAKGSKSLLKTIYKTASGKKQNRIKG